MAIELPKPIAVTPVPNVRYREFTKCGQKPLSGGEIWTYDANSTTPKVTYKDPYGFSPNTNPIILDAAGEADIYLNGTYRFVVKDRHGVIQKDVSKIGSWFSGDLEDQFKSVNDALETSSQQLMQPLADAIDVALAGGAGAAGWVDGLVQTWSGRTQASKNKDEVHTRDFGLVGDGVTDDTIAVQKAVNYASALTKGDSRVTVVIDDPVFMSAQRQHNTGWGSAVIVPDNVNITGNGAVYSNCNFENKTVLFLVRGSNILVSWLRFQNKNNIGNNWDIPVGGGSAYDDSLQSNRVYRNIQCYHLLGLGNWLTCSFQMSHSNFDPTVFLEEIEYIFCKSIAKKNNTSSGNFNFVSNPPHHIRGVKFISCTAKYGATSSSFNCVGVDGGSQSDCDSELNLYAASELESLTRDFTVTGLRSKNDAHGLWIDDSHDITFSNITQKNTIESLKTVSFGISSLNRPVLRITYTKDDAGNPVVMKNIVGSNIIGTNSRIAIGPLGNPVEGAIIDDVTLNSVTITNNGNKYENGNTPLQFNGVNHLSITDLTITGTPDESYEIQGISRGSVSLTKVKTKRVHTEKPLGLYVSGDGDLFLNETDVYKLHTVPKGGKYYTNIRLDGVDQADRKGDQYIFYAYKGNPEGVLTANLGAIVYRHDQPRMYIKTTPSGNTGWRMVAFSDEVKPETVQAES